MKRLYALLFLSTLLPFAASAQQYGNEWINYSQNYYKFNVINDGIYRIDSSALANSGINVSTIDPRNIQIFGRGQEVPLYIKGDTDGVFNSGDFIEFFAQRNDGFLDALMYDTASSPNPHYSLVTDTAVYFLTWNGSTSNLRFAVIDDTSFSSYTPVNYFMRDQVIHRPYEYQYGATTTIGSTDVQYLQSEGWTDPDFQYGPDPNAYTFTTSQVFANGPPTLLEVCAVGQSRNFGNPWNDHRLRIEYLNPSSSYVQVLDTLFKGYRQIRRTFSIPTLNNIGNSTDIRITNVADTFSVVPYLSVGFVRLKFPHNFNMEGQSSFTLFVPDNPDINQSRSYLDLSNFNSNASPVFLYDLTTNKRFYVYPNGSNFRVLVPNSGNEKKCYLTSQSQVTNIAVLKPVTPTAQFTNYSALSYDSAFIIVTEKSLMPQAQQYANYRSSINGGSHNVVLADIDQLYDQFAYGLRKHPLSIRHFAKFALDTANITPPRNLFLIGKGISAELIRLSSSLSAQCLVPSMGYPATDNYFTAGLSGNMLVPAIPTGRLAARTPQEVLDYLSKVMAHENQPAQDWMKHIIHFGGGASPSEQQFIKACLNGYKTSIEGPSYGGVVHSFFKDNSQPVQLTISDSVRYLIDNGVSLMTFFGHASGSSFDQNIDYAANYNNYGKFPLLLANSCFTGDIHLPAGSSASSTSEEWVLIPGKGAIGFIASMKKTSGASLCNYSSMFYNHLSVLSYNKSVGYCMQQTVASTQTQFDQLTNQACMEMSLHGDPSLRINTHPLPDYALADSSIYFNPGIVSTSIDSFDVNIVITNLGKAQYDSLQVELERIFPNGSSMIYTSSIQNVWYRDTISFRLPVDKISGPGLNKFAVKLDPINNIPELDENNNNVVNPNYAYLFILSGEVLPVYPYNYAIVPTDTVTLKASTGDPFAPPSDYEFEIDTTDLYNSPLKLSTTLTNVPGGVMSWKPPLTLMDTTVYYWHVRKKPTDSRNSGWKEFSFQYINGKRGWEQAHFFQYKNDNLTYLDFNRSQRTFDFVATGKTLICDVYGQPLPSFNITQLYACQFKLDLTIQDYAGCGLIPAIHVVVIDPFTLTTWKTRDTLDNGSGDTINPTHVYGNINDFVNRCDGNRTRPDEYFIFRPSNASQLQGMRTMLRDSVPNGYHILMYTWLQGQFQSWADSSVRDYIRDSLGASNISSLQDTISWIYYCVKGDTSTGVELFSDSADQFIRLTQNLVNNANYGTIISELLGPAQSWDSLSWHQLPLNGNAGGDSTTLDIIGVDYNGTETVVRSGLPIDSSNIRLTNINASTYPFMKLRANLYDDSLLTAPQLRKWQVFYAPSPEVAVNPPVFFSFQSDTAQEGDSVRFKVAVTNVSEFNMDSMLVTYWIIDNNRVTHPLPSYMSGPLTAGNSLTANVTFSTYGYPGLNSVWMEINPLNKAQTRNEQFHFNNIAQVGFFVGTDKVNPLLDVTFDGIHILNGDIVSAKPNILVQLKDENQFLALNDTADFKVYIKSPSQQLAQRIYFANNPQLIFTSAVLPNNSCRINYTPVLAEDGIYEMIIQAQDRSSNLSGNIDYRITFEVINKSTITEVLNYPNPFSTATRFVFTLTGSQIPDYFKIQIFTVTGKVVREIDKDELGPLHVGRNITEYAWDGRDEFGDQLANGIYLYRVQTQLGGGSIEHRVTEADQYFKKGFGKMYLMR